MPEPARPAPAASAPAGPTAGVAAGARRFWWMAAAAAALLAAAFWLDSTVIEAVPRPPSPGWARTARIVNRVLDWPLVILGTGAAAAVAGRAGRRDAATSLTSVFLGAAIAGIVATSLRSVIGRTRPGADVEQGWYGPRAHGRWVIGRYAYSAFPSGHTATVAGAAGALVAARSLWAAPAALLTALVAWARIYVGAHRLSDVTAAAILGLAAGALAAGWQASRPRPPPSAEGPQRT